MPRFVIEVPHEPEKMACARAVKIFLNTGSHFLRHADWGCLDGEHKAWIIAEVENKEEARSILAPQFRTEAKITQRNYFTVKEIDELLYYQQR